ncbi:MAG: carboxyl transferase domain-containing protein [Desulfatibacillaceae bacterium]|nr:carboxyl transferase domain-containing protein [Desulfatibacillaceae bacterium]
MDVIASKIDTRSDTYKKNFEAMESLVEDLRKELGRARNERSEKALARLEQSGKLPASKKLELLLDPNSPFLELCPLAAKDMYDGKIHGAGLLSGIGKVGGKEVCIGINDATIKGGSAYPISVKKSLRCQTVIMENRLPSVALIDSAGAYLPLQSQMFPDADGGGRIFYNQARISKMGLPQIAAVMGMCTAGGAYGVAMCDEIVHVKGHGAIFLGGPPLVRAATGDVVTADELGGAMVHCAQSGVSDYIAENDAHAIEIVRSIVANLPSREKHLHPEVKAEPPAYDPKELYGIVSPDLSQAFDIREVIARIVDGSRFLEFKELFGPTLVCGFAHIHGYKVGILGNNGILFSDSALKATQFIQLCDRRGVPLVFLQNITGFIVGKVYEQGGITKNGHKMVNAVSTASVPKFTVLVGASFGAGNYAMCGRAYSPRFLWMWPQAKIGVMGGAEAAHVLVTITNDQNERLGKPPLTKEEEDFICSPVIEGAQKEGNAYYSTARIWDDGIIDPAKTRNVLGLALSAAGNAPVHSEPLGYGIYRM